MLRFLSIKRLAVLDSVEVEFDPGLNVLTGETGAGKSILVEAVGLLLGGRASGDLVRTGEDTATIEAIFEIGGDNVRRGAEQRRATSSGSEIQTGSELIVRREITAQGRSRAFVNGALATASTLKELASGLVELHGQHEHQTLLDPATHVAVLDAFGGFDPLLVPVRAAFGAMRSTADELARVRQAASDRAARQELAAFQLAELDRAGLKPGEDEELAAARQVLASAGRVERLCAESYEALYESDAAVLASLGAVWRRVAELAALDVRFQPYLDARDGIKGQLEDLAFFLRHYAEGIDASPQRLQQVEERLALLERLKRKYGPRLDAVIARRDSLRRELEELENTGERLASLDREHAAARDQYLRAADVLSRARRQAATRFARRIERELAVLAMDRAKFQVRFGEPLHEREWTADGIDHVELFLSANPGEDPRPLARIVSGGELSRVMLAIKTLMTDRGGRHRESTSRGRVAAPGLMAERGGGVPAQPVRGVGAPGLIFDEVDAGIGGRVADDVGRKLRALAADFQVLCITHVPQIAAYADTHFHIEKRVEQGRTRTTVTRLNLDGRVAELSRMLGGASQTDAIRLSAREMLDARAARAKGERKPKGESESGAG